MSTNHKRILTTWEVWTYDVWGNARNGYDVNDRSCIARSAELRLAVETFNPGTPHAFDAAYPSNRAVKALFGLTNNNEAVELDGDDLYITVSRKRDGLPIGELICTSHESLSPIHKVQTPKE